MRALLALPVLLAVTAASSTARAYRPFDGTDADVADFGDFELELGPVHWYSQSTSHYLIAPATVLNLGFFPRWELVVDLQNYVALDPAPGEPRGRLLDTDVFLKTIVLSGSLQEQGSGPSLATEFGPLLPNVNGESGYGASADVIVSQRWSGLTVHANSWLELARGSLHPEWFEGVIVEGDVRSSLRPVSEWFVERELTTGATTVSGLVGGIWRARDGLDFDLGLREASVGGARASEVRLGLTWTLGVWEPAEERGHGAARAPRTAWFRPGP